MLAYQASEVATDCAKGHPRFTRLMPSGPWSYKGHPGGGSLAFWDQPNKFPALTDFGAPRPCADGLIYYPPLVLPELAQLAKPPAQRSDCTWVPLACGQSIAILPAYLEPRRVLAGGELGDPVTAYGAQARLVDGMFRANDGLSLFDSELLKLCRMALCGTYRLTDELIDDLGIFTTEDIDPITDAAFRGPKAAPASAP